MNANLGHALRHPQIRRLLVSVFLSNAAVAMAAVAIGQTVYDRTGRKLDLGFLGLAEFAPAFLLVLLTGSVADRFRRQWVGAICAGGEALTMVGLVVIVRRSSHALWPFVVLAVLLGVSRAFHAPAGRAFTPQVPPPELLPRMLAMNSATWQSASILGPVAGGFLFRIGPAWVFGLAALLVVIAAVLILVIDPHERQTPTDPEDRPSLAKAVEGLRFIRRTPVLLGAISLDLVAVLFGGAYALLPVFAKDILHSDAAGLGLLRAAAGAGAAVTAIALSARPIERRIGPVLFVTVGLFGAASIGFGLSKSFALSLVMLAIVGASDMVSVFIRSTIVPSVTPDDRRGRVMAVENVFIGASNELGAFESGVAAELFGAVPAVVIGGVIVLGVVVVWPFLFRRLGTADRLTDLRAGDANRAPTALETGSSVADTAATAD